MSRYGSREDEIDRLLRAQRFVDLYSIVRQSIRAGVENYSLKQLELFYGFERTVDLRTEATPAIRLIERALELSQPAAVDAVARDAVEGYNREDCESAAFLHRWMEGLWADYAAAGNDIARPEHTEGEASERVTAELAEIRRLAEALTLNLPGEPDLWTPYDRARWLLSHLLEWQRRESKVSYWEYFRLADMTEEELFDEPSAISGLMDRVGVDAAKRLDAYAYPPQEVKIKEGDNLRSWRPSV